MTDVKLCMITQCRYDTKQIGKRSKTFEIVRDNVVKFCCFVNGLIGAETDVNYRITQPILNTNNDYIEVIINFDIQVNTLESNDFSSMILSKSHTIKSFLEHHDWTKTQTDLKRIIRFLFNGIKLKLFSFTSELVLLGDEKICEPIEYNFKKVANENKLVNTSTKNHKQFIDPLLEDYTIVLDASKTDDDLVEITNYGYNYLHLFEHLKTNVWKNLDKTHLKMINGITSVDGTCLVYAVLSNEEAFKSYYEALLKTPIDELLKTFDLEVDRTISETIIDKSFALFGRTNIDGYNKRIIKRINDMLMRIITITPEMNRGALTALNAVNSISNDNDGTEIDKTKNKKEMCVSDNKTKTYSYIPLSVLKDKERRPYQFNGNKLIGVKLEQSLCLADDNNSLNKLMRINCKSGCEWL